MSLDTGIVALIVLAFAVRGFVQLFPSISRVLAARLRGAFGAGSAPLATTASCDSGCGRCGGCNERPAAPAAEQPLTFQAPPRR